MGQRPEKSGGCLKMHPWDPGESYLGEHRTLGDTEGQW